MDTILLLELCILVVSGIFAGVAVYKSKKAGAKDIPWEKIRPMLTQAFIHIKEVQELRGLGYQAMEDFTVVFIREKILMASFLTKEERALISDDLIRSLIAPRLKEIHESLEK